ncbi:MAG: hypothetical protein UX89_C0021G0006 [Parcubacteria group bacterium GW2011_GWA2_47_16]|nr:MAG: hypothetical protein UX89_C0021G0006 [Parcubacteria group bacterium GW2011_GWA2_47_16]
MPIKNILRAILIAVSAMVVAIVFVKSSGGSMEAAVGYSALLVAIAYELSSPTNSPS